MLGAVNNSGFCRSTSGPVLVPLQQQIKQQQRKRLLVSGGAESAAVSPKRLRLAAAWARGAEGHEHGANGTAAAQPLPAYNRL